MPDIIKPLFQLPDGSYLKYAYPWDKGNIYQWFRYYDTPTARSWQTKNKTGLLKVGLWNSGTRTYCVAADFDRKEKLPDGLSFDELYYDLSESYPEAIVIRSVNEKVKAIFAIQSDEISDEIALEFLKKVLTPELYDAVDKTSSALRLTYVTPESTELLSNRLPNIKITPYTTRDTLTGITCSPLLLEPKALKSYVGFIPDSLKHFIGNNPVRDRYIRILLVSGSLLNEDGFNLPTEYLAKQVGTHKQTLSKWNRRLCRLGLLAPVNRKYFPGYKAKSYRAIGALENAIQSIYPKREFLSQVKDGTWEKAVYRVACNLKNEEAVLKWALSVPTIHDKSDRIKKVKRVIKKLCR